MLHGDHGVVNAEVHQSHRPRTELPVGDVCERHDLGLVMAVIGHYTSVEAIDHAALAFEHLRIQTFALAQHTGDVVRAVMRSGLFQNRRGDGGGLWPHSAADVNQAGQKLCHVSWFLEGLHPVLAPSYRFALFQ